MAVVTAFKVLRLTRQEIALLVESLSEVRDTRCTTREDFMALATLIQKILVQSSKGEE